MLILGESVLRTEHDVICFKAEVLYENAASKRVFEKLGYLREECELYVLFTKNLGD